MNRQRTLVALSGLLGVGNVKIQLWVDDQNATKIASIINKHKKEFIKCLIIMNDGRYSNDLYRRENISKKCKHVTAIKIRVGINYRIYCQEEIVDGVKLITMCKSHKKKTQKNDKQTRTIIENVASYQY